MKFLTFVICFLVLFFLSFGVGAKLLLNNSVDIPANTPLPANFPILITWRADGVHNCTIINYQYLDATRENLGHDISLTIDPDEVEGCRESLVGENTENTWYGLTVTETEDGQSIMVEQSKEFVSNVGMYNVTEQEITQARHKFTRIQGKTVFLFMVSFALSSLLSFVTVKKIFKKKVEDQRE